MLKLRKSKARGHTDLGWLDSRHSFSFGHYVDRDHVSFGPLRVLNDDVVAPGGGFPTHPHSDMEILTYVVEGALEHRDSLGNGSVLKAGEFQRMTAGTGISHSEFNPSSTDSARFLQVWIHPREQGLTPSYEQRPLAIDDNPGQWLLVASPDGTEDSLTIHQDARVYAGRFDRGDHVALPLGADEVAWVQVVDGGLLINNEPVATGDGVALTDLDQIAVSAPTAGAAGSRALLFVMSP